MRAVVGALDDAVEAERVGASHQFEIVMQVSSHVAGRMLAANDQAELHCAGSPLMTLPGSSRLAFAHLSRLRRLRWRRWRISAHRTSASTRVNCRAKAP